MKQTIRTLLYGATVCVLAYTFAAAQQPVDGLDPDVHSCDCGDSHKCPSGFNCTGKCSADGDYTSKCVSATEAE